MKPLRASIAVLAALILPARALAWGYEGHEVIAAIARAFMTPAALAKVDALLATDQANTLTGHDMLSESTWADAWRGAGHRETASWHFVDIELDHPDLRTACFGYPPAGPSASQGPADDCLVNKLDEFTRELADPATPQPERLLALKYVLHFVGDLHQPLHAADNHDRGGNCVLISLGGPRTQNLHSYWDTTVVQALGEDSAAVARRLAARITPAEKVAWERGDARAWAMESYGVARSAVYTIGSKPGCETDQSPVPLPAGYAATSARTAALQLEKAGVRLAWVLNRTIGR